MFRPPPPDVDEYAFSDGQESSMNFKQAFEKEQAASATLCSDLEEERITVAIAAEEAMAMILQLQVEKASIEMEARQYQRILVEKSAYDVEEMDVLRESIVRREQEKRVLEKEVEAYRRNILLENELLEGEDAKMDAPQGHNIRSEDPMQMLRQLS
ncbi:hypothetical protein Nepgr_009871 [Nepenthes gracilis]|uniref:GTD-binding domain-containing protein n=1 Tax=Nepenthes gracilis TaxID=150966 RepID=A0AAD3SC63_NEPGR|nr:hypothetical protein Nepgr_009871 [Nepenthes gracilis]